MQLKKIVTWLVLINFVLTFKLLAARVYVHSDNEQDVFSFDAVNPVSLSVETNMLALAIPRVDIRVELVPLKRSLTFMDNEQPVCVINKLKTAERVEKYLFSKPVNLFFNRRLYQQPELEQLEHSESVSLVEIFKRFPERKLIISSQISYGDDLDQQIKQIPKRNVIVRDAGLQGKGIIQMFAQKRADYALLYPQELVTLTTPLNSPSYEVAGINPYVTGHIMCAETALTKQFIGELNENIDNSLTSGELHRAHLKYIDAGSINALERYFKEVFY